MISIWWLVLAFALGTWFGFLIAALVGRDK